jgi:hypothetical protein
MRRRVNTKTLPGPSYKKWTPGKRGWKLSREWYDLPEKVTDLELRLIAEVLTERGWPTEVVKKSKPWDIWSLEESGWPDDVVRHWLRSVDDADATVTSFRNRISEAKSRWEFVRPQYRVDLRSWLRASAESNDPFERTSERGRQSLLALWNKLDRLDQFVLVALGYADLSGNSTREAIRRGNEIRS